MVVDKESKKIYFLNSKDFHFLKGQSKNETEMCGAGEPAETGHRYQRKKTFPIAQSSSLPVQKSTSVRL